MNASGSTSKDQVNVLLYSAKVLFPTPFDHGDGLVEETTWWVAR